MPLRIIDWNDHFENNKSRERDKCSFVCVPNKQDGLGLTNILSLEDGASIYGVWCLLLGAVSRQHKPRDGWLTHNGQQTGTPWAPADMALMWRRDENEITRALQVLMSEKVGWMEDTTGALSARSVPVQCPPSAPEEKRREEKEEKRKETNSELETAQAHEPAVFELELIPRDGSYPITEKQLEEWNEAYPGVRVLQELRKMGQWCKANPTKRKTKRGAMKFMVNWLNKAQDETAKRGSPFGRPSGDRRSDMSETDRIDKLYDERSRKQQAQFAREAEAAEELARRLGNL